MKKPTVSMAYQCAAYILEHEREDYENWCEENGHDPDDTKTNAGSHIYACAVWAVVELKTFGVT